MHRRVAVLAMALVPVLAAVGCTDDRPARAFAAFQAMAAAPDFRYSATMTSRNESSGSGESLVEVLVVGRDSHLELRGANGNVTFEVIVLGGTTFTRDGGGGGAWRRAERDASTTDFSPSPTDSSPCKFCHVHGLTIGLGT